MDLLRDGKLNLWICHIEMPLHMPLISLVSSIRDVSSSHTDVQATDSWWKCHWLLASMLFHAVAWAIQHNCLSKKLIENLGKVIGKPENTWEISNRQCQPKYRLRIIFHHLHCNSNLDYLRNVAQLQHISSWKFYSFKICSSEGTFEKLAPELAWHLL